MTGAPSLLWGKEPEAKGMKPSSTRDPPSVRQGDLAQGTTPRSIADPHQGFRAGMCAQGTEPKSGLGPAREREREREKEREREREGKPRRGKITASTRYHFLLPFSLPSSFFPPFFWPR